MKKIADIFNRDMMGDYGVSTSYTGASASSSTPDPIRKMFSEIEEAAGRLRNAYDKSTRPNTENTFPEVKALEDIQLMDDLIKKLREQYADSFHQKRGELTVRKFGM